MHISDISELLRSSKDSTEPVRVSGTTAPTRALIAARFCQSNLLSGARHFVILCPNDDQATEFLNNFESLSGILPSEIETGSIRYGLQLFPSWDQSPYSPIAPSLKTRYARMAVLNSLIHDSLPQVIVTTLPALCQATLPREIFRQFSISISLGETLHSRESLGAALIQAGYLRTDSVEDPGTFAIRGDIVDIFPCNRVRPVRVELFGDWVETLREFDPISQRTLPVEGPPLSQITIAPAREVLINETTSATLREKLKAHADDVGIPRSIRDPILTSLKEGIYPDHSDAWAAFAYTETACLLDYLEATPKIVWNDELSCLEQWDEFLAEQQTLSADAVQSGLILPPFETLFAWNKPIQERVRSQSCFFLDRLVLSDSLANSSAESSSESSSEDSGHRFAVSVQNNADLLHGTRHSLGELEPHFKTWLKGGFKILVFTSTQSQLERIRFLLEERKLPCQEAAVPQPSAITLKIGNPSEGFRWPAEGLVILTESEILGARHVRKQKRAATPESPSASQDWSALKALSDLAPGDAVVHIDHGIGRYQGLSRLDLSGAPCDFLQLEYANKDKLYIPVYRLNVIQKYVGSSETVGLDRLGTYQFTKTKERVKDAVKKLAINLVQLYAERKIRPGFQFSPRDAAFQEFEASFPFEETPDQLKAIDAVLSDMESGKVMDRLVCGDVGYGKTEVAIRAAFRAVSDGKQVAVLVPTTVLAQQHEQSFKTRLKDYPLLIESVSRFKNTKEQRAILEAVSGGKIDIIIGTHRLLSKDVSFKDLGLIIVDEEHRFGVEHKERLKTLKVNTHVLTLTATPIPRTLHMALSGLRDISLINTPPVDRLPIRTYVSKYEDSLVKRAIEFELSRGGQIFYLHNRVQTIFRCAARLKELVPSAEIIVGHGQMAESELEDAMLSFYRKKANVLVCTAIIESGLDIPSANTIIIERADTLGLSQLYQIRGRVGRGQQRGYAYLTIPAEGALTEDAKRRLEVIQRFVELGSGFQIASHDLEIRGGGNLLGPQQSGNIAAVGFDLYTELLEEAIRELQGKPLPPEESRKEPEIKAPFPAFLAESYVPDVHQRLSLYRRFSAAIQDQDVDRMEEELRDRFGDLPIEAQNLLWMIRIKILLKRMGIESLTVGPEKVSLVPGPQSQLDPVRAIALISAHPHNYQLMPDSKLVARVRTHTIRDLFFDLEKLFEAFAAS